MSARCPSSLLAVLFLCGVGLIDAIGQEFPIQLARAVKTGDQYGIIAVGSSEQTTKMAINGQALPPESEEMAVRLVAKVEVVETTPKGREKRTRLTVTKATRTQQGVSTELLPIGTVLMAERVGEKTQFLVEEKPVAADVAKALDIIVSVENEDGANDDILFGTQERKKVGDSWSVNGKAAAEDLARESGLKFGDNAITGTTTLAELITDKAGDALRIAVTMKITEVSVDLPPGMKIESSHFDALKGGVFPVDLKKRALSKSMGINGTFVCEGEVDGQKISMTLVFKESSEITFTSP